MIFSIKINHLVRISINHYLQGKKSVDANKKSVDASKKSMNASKKSMNAVKKKINVLSAVK